MSQLKLLVAVVLLLGIAAVAQSAEVVMINKRPMISLRVFAETFGARIDYDRGRADLSIALGGRTVYLRPYRTYAWIDSRRCNLDSPVVIIDHVTYLPAHFIFDAFGLRSDWRDRDTRVIVHNRWNRPSISLVLNLTWGKRPHAWQRTDDCRIYANYHRPNHQYGSYGKPSGSYKPHGKYDRREHDRTWDRDRRDKDGKRQYRDRDDRERGRDQDSREKDRDKERKEHRDKDDKDRRDR
ncbi:MAG: copper amine oxidase N-terminal domain-containing protein [Armatimonadota bacterium]